MSMGVSDERDSWRVDDDDAEEYEVVSLEQLAVVTCMFICEGVRPPLTRLTNKAAEDTSTKCTWKASSDSSKTDHQGRFSTACFQHLCV